MGLERILKKPLTYLLAAQIGLLGNMIYTNVDISNDRSEKHQKAPITIQIEERKGEKYAILVSADGEDRYKENITFGYQSLLSAGFKAENIYVLSGHEDIGDYNRGEATQENLKKYLSELKGKIDQDDFLLFYMTNHGGKEYIFFGESEVELDRKNVTASNLRDMFNGINPNYAIAVFTQCQPGEFLDYFGQSNRIAIGSSRKNKNSFGNDFSIAFFEGLGGRDKSGNQIDSDSNNDGKISIEELFDYASRNDKNTEGKGLGKETPQMYWQNANPRDLYIR